MLRRRRREGDDQPGLVDHDGPEPQDDQSDLGGRGAGGPWDIADDYPAIERIDCGSLLIPMREGFEVQHGGQKGGFSEDLHAHDFDLRIMVLSGEITLTREGMPAVDYEEARKMIGGGARGMI